MNYCLLHQPDLHSLVYSWTFPKSHCFIWFINWLYKKSHLNRHLFPSFSLFFSIVYYYIEINFNYVMLTETVFFLKTLLRLCYLWEQNNKIHTISLNIFLFFFSSMAKHHPACTRLILVDADTTNIITNAYIINTPSNVKAWWWI